MCNSAKISIFTEENVKKHLIPDPFPEDVKSVRSVTMRQKNGEPSGSPFQFWFDHKPLCDPVCI
jgi:hypothetical protein